MRILLVGDFSDSGGAKTYFKYLLRFYRKNRFEVVLAITERQLDREIQQLLDECQVQLVPIRDRTLSCPRLLSHFPLSILVDICILARALRERPDMIVVSAAAAGTFLGLMVLPYKCLYIVHVYPSGRSDDSIRSVISNILRQVFFRVFLGSRKQIVAVSEFQKAIFRKRWVGDVDAKWINVIHNTSMLEHSNSGRKHVRYYSQVRVLTLGLVAWSKNPKVWMDVAREVVTSLTGKMQVEFVWAGDGDLLAECRARIQGYHIHESVRFIGYQAEVGALYEECDIYFQPSRLESHGLAVVDAMRLGLPCVVSRVGGLPESVVDGVTGYVVDIEDLQGMAKRIIQLATSAELRARMGKAAAERYNLHFGPEAWEAKMRGLHLRVGDGENA